MDNIPKNQVSIDESWNAKGSYDCGSHAEDNTRGIVDIAEEVDVVVEIDFIGENGEECEDDETSE
jgi:hypothetical protein